MIQRPSSATFYLHFFNFPAKYARGDYDQVCSFKGYRFGGRIYSNLETLCIEKKKNAKDLNWGETGDHYKYAIRYHEDACGTLSFSFFGGRFCTIGRRQVNNIPCTLMGVSKQYRDSYVTTNYVIDIFYWDIDCRDYGHYQARIVDKSYEEIWALNPAIKNGSLWLQRFFNVICYLDGGYQDESEDSELS